MVNAEKTFTIPGEINQLGSWISSIFNSNKEIFVCPSSDSTRASFDKIQFENMKLEAQPELFIKLVLDKVNKTLSIIYNGIVMKKADLWKDLDRIATSGTEDFMEALKAEADLVAEKVVVVTTRDNDDKQYIWESQDGGSFTVTRNVNGEQRGRGTKITLFMKEDQLEFLEERGIKDLVKKLSEFISYPIYLGDEKTTEEEISDDEEGEPKKEEAGAVEEVDEGKETKSKKKKIKEPRVSSALEELMKEYVNDA